MHARQFHERTNHTFHRKGDTKKGAGQGADPHHHRPRVPPATETRGQGSCAAQGVGTRAFACTGIVGEGIPSAAQRARRVHRGKTPLFLFLNRCISENPRPRSCGAGRWPRSVARHPHGARRAVRVGPRSRLSVATRKADGVWRFFETMPHGPRGARQGLRGRTPPEEGPMRSCGGLPPLAAA